jgi:hypothetical protein
MADVDVVALTSRAAQFAVRPIHAKLGFPIEHQGMLLYAKGKSVELFLRALCRRTSVASTSYLQRR